MKNVKDFGSFLNESTSSSSEESIFIGPTIGAGFNKLKPLDTIKKIPGVSETKLKDGTSIFTYTDPKTKVSTWVFYGNGRAYGVKSKSMYSYFYDNGFIRFKKDAGKPGTLAPAKVGDFMVVSSSNPLNTSSMGSGNVAAVEKTGDGWTVRVKGSFTEDGKKWKSGTLSLNSKYDKFGKNTASTENLLLGLVQ